MGFTRQGGLFHPHLRYKYHRLPALVNGIEALALHR